MVIQQGDVFWVNFATPIGSEPGFRHPAVVIQNNIFNHSRIHTVVVCAITSNLQLSNAIGNVLLPIGEANLQKRSLVNISQIYTMDKSQLHEKIGSLSWDTLNLVVEGVWKLLEPRVTKRS